MDLSNIQPGQSAEQVVFVTKDMTTNRTGKEGADVLSTPALLGLMEDTSIKATDDRLPKGFTTVGFAVDGLRHIAPTSIGGKVTVRSELTNIDKNKLSYSIEAYEGDTKIGVASHRRAVIPSD
jgi:predicted thioesterase